MMKYNGWGMHAQLGMNTWNFDVRLLTYACHAFTRHLFVNSLLHQADVLMPSMHGLVFIGPQKRSYRPPPRPLYRLYFIFDFTISDIQIPRASLDDSTLRTNCSTDYHFKRHFARQPFLQKAIMRNFYKHWL